MNINEQLKLWVDEGKNLTEITKLIEEKNLITAKNVRDAINKRIKGLGYSYEKATEKYLKVEVKSKDFAKVDINSDEAFEGKSLIPRSEFSLEVVKNFQNVFERLAQLESEVSKIKSNDDITIRFDETILQSYPKESIVTSLRVNKAIWKKLNILIEKDYVLGRISKMDAISIIFARAIEEMEN